MTCTRFSLNSRNRSASGAKTQNPIGALTLNQAEGLSFLRPLLYVHPLVEFLNTPLYIYIYIYIIFKNDIYHVYIYIYMHICLYIYVCMYCTIYTLIYMYTYIYAEVT